MGSKKNMSQSTDYCTKFYQNKVPRGPPEEASLNHSIPACYAFKSVRKHASPSLTGGLLNQQVLNNPQLHYTVSNSFILIEKHFDFN